MEVFTMQIQEALETLKIELSLGRTPKGRDITEFGKESLKSVIGDTANHSAEATRCKNCGLIISSLLVSDGCPNCGGLDFDANIS